MIPESFAYVILQYQTVTETIECVDSILKSTHYRPFHIVVVDNGSPNHSGPTLCEHYRQNEQVHVILNQGNLGFARGNNAGYQFARDVLKSSFIFIINNDTIIDMPDLPERIIHRYNQEHFDVLGPDIISLRDRAHQNPRKEVFTNVDVINGYLMNFRIILLLNYLRIDTLAIRIKKFFRPSSKLPSAQSDGINPDNREMIHVKLHGSALLFSPGYLKKYTEAFHPGTFLYCEESFLYHKAIREGLILVYHPEVWIYHKEDATTDFMNLKAGQKRRFFLKHNIHSLQELKKYLNQ